MTLFRLFTLRKMPRYRRRKVARQFVTMFADPKLLGMIYLTGFLSGVALCLYVAGY